MSDLSNGLATTLQQLSTSQQSLAEAITTGDNTRVNDLLDNREPVWHQLADILNNNSDQPVRNRPELEELLRRELQLQEQLQGELREIDSLVREVSCRQQVLKRYRLPVKHQPRFIDRNG
ncbi:hypothetical protein H8D51_04135 [bacterium]|nr:hypothetical protein [bacterium]